MTDERTMSIGLRVLALAISIYVYARKRTR